MYKLSTQNYKSINETIRNQFNCHNVFVYSVLDENQPGTVYVNNLSHPTAGIVVHRGGCYYAFGVTTDYTFNNRLLEFLKDRTNHTNYYDLYVSSIQWLHVLETVLKGNVVRLNRSHYILREDIQMNEQLAIPDGYQLIPIDAQLFVKYRDTMDKTYENLWNSENEYLQKAFGFCAQSKGEFVSVCNTFFIGGGLIAPDIVTLENHRGIGLATTVCKSYIRKCKALGLTPYWDCDAGDDASNRLAQRLGFSKIGTVPILWWHENQDVIVSYLKKNNYPADYERN